MNPALSGLKRAPQQCAPFTTVSIQHRARTNLESTPRTRHSFLHLLRAWSHGTSKSTVDAGPTLPTIPLRPLAQEPRKGEINDERRASTRQPPQRPQEHRTEDARREGHRPLQRPEARPPYARRPPPRRRRGSPEGAERAPAGRTATCGSTGELAREPDHLLHLEAAAPRPG